ncbi:hypothetical protein HY29_06605 [Hyphomonas beringensis]|uniref:Sensor protein FixL n=1 Tax=Hyphomonas beringensis TaxID=1280946 RepID=A0A062TYB7_9PROT|nr:PAS domain-containing sensor histidine kinase [Hyphomonas beringensis]KCZ51017.1 hypothetical protein HY29_06605 [Hyphomonas beringensis]
MSEPSNSESKTPIGLTGEQSLQSLLSSMLASVPDAMIVIDEHGIVMAFSSAAEKMFGYKAADIAGKNVSVLMTHRDEDHHNRYIRNYLDTGVAHIIGIGRIVEAKLADGSTIPVELKIGEADISGRKIFTGYIRDVTDQQAQQHKLSQLQAEVANFSRLSAVGSMASAMAHELNQPLTAVANYLEAARDMLDTPDEASLAMAHEALDAAAKQSIRAGQIVRRLRDYVSRGEIEMRPMSLPAIVAEAVSLSKIGIEGPIARILQDVPEDLPLVRADKLQLRQVIVNLVRNALEALAETDTPVITVKAQIDDQEPELIRVTICDNGPGLSMESGHTPFDAFNSSKSSGMGLGLSICKTIVEAHGGDISVDSPQGKGACFSFTLHRADEVADT